ncbi:unnamed protein product [Bemisia tabaci]|uniref:N-acetyltransferase domain-containing protein n=1 Tax=Bemisia tabaci TaxID=7038 RepID=A0A9P0G106_BEMTA|nr:unnamed protein product [Bemisia tabaci]
MISWTDHASMMLPEDPLHPVPWTRMDELSAKLRIDVPISQPDSNDYRITLHCFNKETSALKNALIMTSRIEWKSPKTTVFFNAFHADLLSIVNECLSTHKFQIFTKRNCIYKWKSPEQLVEHEISCPEDVFLAPVNLESLDMVRRHRGQFPGVEEFVATLILHKPSLGVYSRRTGELCAWVLCNEYYALASLHTLEAHRRKGYAQLLCNALSEQLLRSNIVIGALVEDTNIPSLTLFKSLNFKSIQPFHYISAARSVTAKE